VKVLVDLPNPTHDEEFREQAKDEMKRVTAVTCCDEPTGYSHKSGNLGEC
jgi:hypothetical protein